MKIFQLIIFSIFLLQSSVLFANENNQSIVLSSTQMPSTPPWLGISVEPLSSALRYQLHGLIAGNQGVLISSVSPRSPAEKAGIQRNDVLLSYDNYKLYSPGQLFDLVRNDKTGRSVSLEIIQQGQSKILKVPLDKLSSRSLSRSYPLQRPLFGEYSPLPPNFNKQSNVWDSFESVKVNTLANGRYHAEVSYKDHNNKTNNFVFEGKREEIIEQINNEKNLPQDKKNALLRALNLKPADFFHPRFFQQNPFQHPFFQQGPFHPSYFQNRYLRPPFYQPNNGY